MYKETKQLKQCLKALLFKIVETESKIEAVKNDYEITYYIDNHFTTIYKNEELVFKGYINTTTKIKFVLELLEPVK